MPIMPAYENISLKCKNAFSSSLAVAEFIIFESIIFTANFI